MQNSYLIPANSKKSKLILGFFTTIDLIIIISGAVITLALLLIVPSRGLGVLILKILPVLIAAFLIIPVQYYHNVLQLIINTINYFTNRRRYYWKGWCVYERFNDEYK